MAYSKPGLTALVVTQDLFVTEKVNWHFFFFFSSALYLLPTVTELALPLTGGKLAVTDANVVLGRVLPDHFPKVSEPSWSTFLRSMLTASISLTDFRQI